LNKDSGRLEVITGGMFSGKSEELIRRVKRAQIARQNVQVFKPALDKRYKEMEVCSHNGLGLEALPVNHPEELFVHLKSETQVVAIDEIQFFSDEIVNVCQQLADQGKRVVVAGLDQDFRGEPFGPIPALMATAEIVDKLQAICVQCGQPASRSQRMIDGEPAGYNDEKIKIGASEFYEARCRHCHHVPIN